MYEEEKAAQTEKFAMFAQKAQEQRELRANMKTTGDDMSYQNAFRDLYYSYYEIHPESAPDFDNPNIPLPYFRYASQLYSETGKGKTVLFPITKNGTVINILTANINDNEDFLDFYIAEKNDFINGVIDIFSQKMASAKSATDRDGDGALHDIEEVIIPPPATWPPVMSPVPPPRSSECDDLSDHQNNGCGGPPPSTCQPYQNCNPVGGSGTTTPEKPKPCKTIQKVGKNAKTKTLFGDLKTKSTQTDANGKYKETGYLLTENNDSVTEQQVNGIPGKNGIDLSISDSIDGFIHNHNPGMTFSVFSSADLASLSWMYKAGKIKDLNSFVFGLVSAKGTQYFITIDDPEALNTFAENFLTNGEIDKKKVDDMDEQYLMSGITYGDNLTSNEAGFLYLLNKFSSGLSVLKGDSTFSNWQQIERGYNDQIISTPCN